MTKYTILGLLTIPALAAWGVSPVTNTTPETKPPVSTNAAPSTTSIEEMLVIGPSPLKLHSLAMITQGKATGGVDERFLPGFKVCSEDTAVPVRSVTARLLGQHFVEGKEIPNPEAVALLIKLAKDESADVRYNAVYHGLTQIQNKSPEIVEILIDAASTDREKGLYERIALSLENNREEATQILDGKLKTGSSIAIYEIYEGLTGKKPVDADKYLNMPSSRPKMFIFKGGGENAEAFKAELEAELKPIGLTNSELHISGTGKNYVLMLKTYITKDRIAVEETFANHEQFKITQMMWLTPEREIQMDAMRGK